MKLRELDVGSWVPGKEFGICVPTRFLAALALVAMVLAACGGAGGGGDGSTSSGNGSQPTGSIGAATTITSRINGTTYALNVYLPPPSAGRRTDLPVVYVLDGENWFREAEGISESAIVVGINSMGLGQRAHDFVPRNNCTGDGGGHVAYFNFIRQELVPYIERTFGGSPSRRALFGHSHGGSFVLYALFAEAADQHTFQAYLSSDASLECMPAEADRWEQDYASAYRALPVRLHVSYATGGNAIDAGYASQIAQRNYEGLNLVSQSYSGCHTCIVPQVLRDGIAFAFP